MQKNRINLFSEEFIPKFQLVTLRFSVICWCLALGLTIALWWYFQQQLESVNAQGEKLQTQLEQSHAVLQEATEAITGRKVDVGLQQQLNSLQADVTAKKRILDELAQRDQLKAGGYANLMQALAEQSSSDLWLTNIRIHAQNLLIEGGALQSEAVPKWVKRLSNIAFFDGKSFADVKMYRDKDDKLWFLLATQSAAQAASNQQNSAKAQTSEDQH